jgi:hypothetical protein
MGEVSECPGQSGYCSLRASFLLRKISIKTNGYDHGKNHVGRILHDGPFTAVRNARWICRNFQFF